MSFADPSMALLAACGGDTVKLFDLSVESDSDPYKLSYSPSPGHQVNSVKWNHTNLVVASAGDGSKISLWHKNGQSLGTVPVAGTDSGDNINECISTISFSNKSSRYICSGGSGYVVRIWDLQRKRCIKWLKGHTDTITGAMYNCKDEHLASISLRGDLILHNLASGTRATELKDPNEQVLRVLDYSRISRHLLVTAGDDGSVHLWDTTGRSPKVSWSKQHSAPTTGVSFSPSNDKIIACVGLDKKLYTLDSGSKRSTFCIPYETPFSSLAFRDDGWILAAGTNNGQIVFFDVRGKPQPLTVLRAYGISEAVTSLCWQRSKPNMVNESNCNAETALLGSAGEDSILMPDPLPSVTPPSLSLPTAVSGSRSLGRSSISLDVPPILSTAEETPVKNHLWTGGTLSRLNAPHSTNFKDDMEVFSPLVDVQPITPSLDKMWDDHDDPKAVDRKPTSLLFPSSMRRFPFGEDGGGTTSSHPLFDWKSDSSSKQDDTRSSLSLFGSTPTISSKSEDSLPTTPPEAWGGEGLSDKVDQLRQPFTFPSRFGMITSGGLTSGSVPGSSTSNAGSSYKYLRTKDTSFTTETSSGNIPEYPRRFSTYAERISTTPSFSDGTSLATGSPKAKKTGNETREELNLLSAAATGGAGMLPTINEGTPTMTQRVPQAQSDSLQSSTSSFSLQLVQHALEETLASVQKSIHDDMRNLHIELLRQFHIQETETTSSMNSVMVKLDELTKEVKFLREENKQLRQLL
ncbi:hypothetical protein ACHQM5_020136 [Ranunculus cassubicifolius]